MVIHLPLQITRHMSPNVRRLLVCAAFVAALLLTFATVPQRSLADACTPPVANPIACENSQPGTNPTVWRVNGAGDDDIQGYASAMSVNVGGTVSFKVKSLNPSYHADIYRLGYYGGDGARAIPGAQGLVPTNTTAQPSCMVSNTNIGLVDCGNWHVSLSWTVPSTAVSGVYIAHLTDSSGADSQIVFVVRNDSSHSDIVVQTSDETWQAYNTYGGNSLYTCTVDCPDGNPKAYKAAFKVSYNRPFSTADDDGGRSWLFSGGEYPMIRYLEANGYDVSYISGLDTSTNGGLLLNHKVFISSGHDEYWTGQQRTNVEAARAAGVSLAFFTGNEVFWKTRLEPSTAGTTTPNRTLVSYKDTHYDQRKDPVSWTGTWRDPRFTIASDGAAPENSLTGQSFVVNSGTSAITVPYAYSKLRLWRDTDVATLTPGGSRTLAPNTLGYEWDADVDNGYRPAGAFKVSSTTVNNVEAFTDYGSTTTTGATATHNMTIYRAPSGALAFGAGTVQWAWGLDAWVDGSVVSTTMRQATVNLLADMGAQPATLQAGLHAETASTDTTAPTATITSPPSSVSDGQQATISGAATDAGGGVVAGVEVSTDGGAIWHPANGTTNWTYTWLAHGNPTATIKVRAVDDSGNLQTPGAGVDVAVNCPCSLWGTSMSVPTADRDSGDPSGIELGVKFTSDKFGTVSGVRFYKASTNTGTHIGSLWTADGQRLAQATFSGETSSGWQTVTFNGPVTIQPNTTYIASYYAPNGHYSGSGDYFWPSPAPGPNGGAIVDSAPLHAVRNAGTTTNGLYSYNTSSTFPTNSFSAGNYWVDVTFTPTPVPGAVTGVSATPGGKTSANLTWTAPSTGGAVTSYRITPYIGSAPQTPTVINGSPPLTTTTITGLTNGTTYTFKVEALNPNGAGPASAASNAVTPLTAVAPSVPLNVLAQPASQSIRVTWAAPQSDGDSAITGYTITPYIGATAQTPVQAGASATSATVSALTNGTGYTVRVTATNGAGTSPAAASSTVVPQATMLDFVTPPAPDSGDTMPVELGVKFKADFNGSITGIRFYKASTNTGTHIGNLWSAGGTRLAQATFANETASGWQTVTFASPVSVTAGTTYVASYFAPNGHYSATINGFTSAIDNPPLHALADATSSNGVYAYGATSTFPSSSYRASNYYVDVFYAIPAPGQVTGVSADESGATSAIVTWSPPASGGPVTSYRVTPYVGASPQAPTLVTGSPLPTSKQIPGLTIGTTYTFTVEALNANGAGGASAHSNSVTPTGPVPPTAPTAVTADPASSSARVTWTAPSADGDSPITGYTITPYIGLTAQSPTTVSGSTTTKTVTGLSNGTDYTFKVVATNAIGASPASTPSSTVTPDATIFDFATPTTIDDGDPNSLTLGVKFQTDFAGEVAGIRFYKSAANTGTHVGALWTSGGALLAQATFTSESASGWQDVTFSSPVTITPGTTYVAGYFAPNGHYSVTVNGLSSAVDNVPLHALSNGVSANGLFGYGSSVTFPTGSFNAGNYWVDVLFEPAPAPGAPTGVSATAGQGSATVSWTAPATGGPATSYKVTPYIGASAQTATTVTGSPLPTSKVITGLTAGTAYTFKVQGINMSGTGPSSSASNSVTPTGATAPTAPTGVTATGDSKSALVRWTASSSDGGSPITGYTVTPYIGAAAQTPVSAGATATSAVATGLTNGTAYTFKVTATNAAGVSAPSTASASVTPRASILEVGTPATVDGGDGNSVVVGVKFTPDVDGTVTGVRFYKASANTGTHVGTLWSAGGTQLGQATFAGETASGWQSVAFATPVSVTAGTTYVTSYLAPNGHYSVTGAGFANAVDNPPLHALSNNSSPNGVYTYSSSSVFPSSSWNASNYWVDVLFAPQS